MKTILNTIKLINIDVLAALTAKNPNYSDKYKNDVTDNVINLPGCLNAAEIAEKYCRVRVQVCKDIIVARDAMKVSVRENIARLERERRAREELKPKEDHYL